MPRKMSLSGPWSSMPAGVLPLFCIQIVCTLSYSVLFSSLVLYMKHELGFANSVSSLLMGVFVGYNFALHLLGGVLAGRFISNRLLFCIGMAAQMIGCMLLSITQPEFLYYGLAVFLTGSGLNVTCLNCMLTQLFDAKDKRRETAFFWNYAGMNLGFFVGFTLSGFFELQHAYSDLFILSSLGNLLAVVICIYHWSAFRDKGTIWSGKQTRSQVKQGLVTVLFIITMPIMLRHLLYQAELASALVIIAAIAMFVIMSIVAYRQQDKAVCNKILAFLILTLLGMVFFTLYSTAPIGLTHFIDHNVDRTVSTFRVPPQWFQNVNTFAIIVGGPLLSMAMNRARSRGVEITLSHRFFLALFLISVGFLILPMGIRFASAHGLVSPTWIVASFILQSIGELFISPVGYAMVGALIPRALQGVMMGVWMMTSGVGSTLAGYSSLWMTAGQTSNNPLLTNANYAHVFSILGLIALSAAVILLIISQRLNQLLEDEAPAAGRHNEVEKPLFD